MMLAVHCKKNGLQHEATLRRILKGVKEDIQDIILSIFNMMELKSRYTQPLATRDPIWFVKREKYSDELV